MNKINLQSGRSMIEMLGVLAIIGVLSVGGIMGYSKAMMRYKINKTIEQITYIAGNVRTTFASQGNYEGLNYTSLWKKAHIFPDETPFEMSTGSNIIYDFKHAWDSHVGLFSVSKKTTDIHSNKAFAIYYANISEDVCIELITQDWKNAQVKMIKVSRELCPGGCPYDPSFYLLPPVRIDDAVTKCSQANNPNGLGINLTFFFDTDTSDSYWKDQIDDTSAALAGS